MAWDGFLSRAVLLTLRFLFNFLNRSNPQN